MNAYVFPGQGSQFVGMGKDLFDNSAEARAMFAKADEIIGFGISKMMFEGTDEDLRQTNVTQPAIFIHSTILANVKNIQPAMVAGHSLGEFSALVAAKALSFEDGLKLVIARANAMQKACVQNPGTMAAILGMEDDKIAEICAGINGVVVPANFNCPGQVVISGAVEAVKLACEALTAAGAKRAVPLPVGGAFHSPLMQPAQDELSAAIASTMIHAPVCPIYQNVDALPTKDPEVIKQKLNAQLTGAVRWTQIVQNMLTDGGAHFTEVGPGNVLQGLVKKVDRAVATEAAVL